MSPTDAEIPSVSFAIKRTLIEHGQQPIPIDLPHLEAFDGFQDKASVFPTDQLPPAIRIIKPVPMPSNGEPLDAVQTALREVKSQSVPISVASPVANGRIARIEQNYVGELTGSITGQVFCYGYAVHDGIAVFVNMAGSRIGVEAIRAKLSKGDQVYGCAAGRASH